MRGARSFFDTNVLIYAFAKNDRRTEAAEKILIAGGVVGVQTLNEFVAVSIRKLSMSLKEVVEAVNVICALCPSPVPITIETHNAELRIMQRYVYHIYDSLMISAALEASCQTLYSEDMRNGQVIDGLTIRNPFL